MSRDLPLSGLRVADFTWIGAGSYTTRLLADLGADVIKIESNSHLDSLRESRPFPKGISGKNRSGYFADRNAGKRSVTLNMKTPEGRELARKLILRSDLVGNNFTPGTMEKFGLGYESLKQEHPGLIYLAMSMQGSDGPESRYLGYGLTMGALTGLQYLAGLPDRDPAGTGTNYPDHVPNPAHAAFAVLAALRHRRRTGCGQMIDLAQIEPTISLLGPAVLDFTANGHVQGRVGNQHVKCVPYGTYPCLGEDRWIALAAETDEQWESLAAVLQLPKREDFRTAAGRWNARESVEQIIANATRQRDVLELTRQLQMAGVPAGPVNDARDVLSGDQQLKYRDHWAYLDHPEMGVTAYGKMPFRLSDTDLTPTRPAPCLGQHTSEICREEFGMTDQEIERLRESQILW